MHKMRRAKQRTRPSGRGKPTSGRNLYHQDNHQPTLRRNPMKINKIRSIFFSPTGTSKAVVTAIVAGLPGIPTAALDLTPPGERQPHRFGSDELAVIGVPVYAGRVASLAVERLRTLQGDKTPAVIVVIYGNRAFDDALIELRDIAVAAGFRPIAAGAFIGEHSFSGADTPIAAGRPDSTDLAAATDFGAHILAKLDRLQDIESARFPIIPGATPYREGMKPLPFTPAIRESACTLCGACLEVCPSGAISLADRIKCDSDRCIFCCACIKTCPENALFIDAAPLQQTRQWLVDHCTARKDPEIFID